MTVTLHSRNKGFEWHQPAPPFRRISNAQADAYGRRGAFVLEDAFSRDEIAPIRR